MSGDVKKSPEWARGDTAQRQWADVLTERGSCALPTYAFEDVTKETKAPVMLIPGGLLVTPDVLCMSGSGITWHEVKSKSCPSWNRNRTRWEHGFDHSLLREYQDVARRTGCPVWIVVYEISSPENPLADSKLVPSGLWLCMALSDVMRLGRHQHDWPGGKAQPHRRGRRGEGGWLWARVDMTELSAMPLQSSVATTTDGGVVSGGS